MYKKRLVGVALSLSLFLQSMTVYSVTHPEQVYSFENYSKVSYEFADMGNMYKVGNIVWGGFPGYITWATYDDADYICNRLRGTSRIPKASEVRELAKALGKGHAVLDYKPTLLPGFEGSFWIDSSFLDPNVAMAFNTETGEIESVGRKELNLVRCVAEL